MDNKKVKPALSVMFAALFTALIVKLPTFTGIFHSHCKCHTFVSVYHKDTSLHHLNYTFNISDIWNSSEILAN